MIFCHWHLLQIYSKAICNGWYQYREKLPEVGIQMKVPPGFKLCILFTELSILAKGKNSKTFLFLFIYSILILSLAVLKLTQKYCHSPACVVVMQKLGLLFYLCFIPPPSAKRKFSGVYWNHPLSHNNPCFPCNIAITNFLILYTCEIRFYDIIDRTVHTLTS